MGETKRRHHTVPNFYLKGFASARTKPQIGAVDVRSGKRIVMSTADATVQKDFYTLEGHPDGDDVFEDILADLEGTTAAVFKKIVSDGIWPLASEDRDILATFLVFQLLRGQDARTSLDQMHGTLMSALVTQLGEDGVRNDLVKSGKEVSDAAVKALVQQATQPEGLEVRITPLAHIEKILDMVPSLIRYFVGRPWILVRFTRKKLLTCDTPISLISDQESTDFYQGVGLSNAWGISIPLTREIGLLLGNPEPVWEEEQAAGRRTKAQTAERVARGGYDHEQVGSTKMAQLFNVHSLSNARSWVFHHPDDAALVSDDLGTSRDRETAFGVITG